MKFISSFFSFFLLVSFNSAKGQDTAKVIDSRAQLNSFLSRGSVSVNFGYIYYPFTNDNLITDGYGAESIKTPPFAARILLGYRLNNNFSIHYSVMRPALWPTYQFINVVGAVEKHGVWVNEWGLTLKGQFPLNPKNNFFLEGGLGLLSRNGFITGNERAKITDEAYLTFLSCAGIQHHFKNNWDAVFMTTFSPPSKTYKQPYTLFGSLGFVYNMHKLSPERVAKNASTPFIFPKQMIQIGAASNVAGFTANDLFSVSGSHIGLPIFWRGVIQTKTGGAINYQRNVFHSRRVFSLDWGTSFSFWQTESNKDQFFAISVFPVMRFWFLRNKFTDNYFVYSIVGPSFVSKRTLASRYIGSQATYQDFLGFGTFFGKKRNLNAELKIEHYSNGNIFDINPGVDIPLMLNVGYAF